VAVATGLIAWVLLTPFASGALIGRSAAARRALARAYPLPFALGWLGVALLFAGIVVLAGPAAVAAALAGGPLSGLALWGRRVEDSDDDDGGDHRDPPPDEPPPDDDGVDWDEFERAFREYADRSPGTRVPCATGPSSRWSSSRPAG
jgi:hypothetical protein